MPSVLIRESPLDPSGMPVRIHYRVYGEGRPLVFLHGGWGYRVYPFDRQIGCFRERCRILIPDRTGYGQSGRIDSLPPDFHQRAAEETLLFLEALGVERPLLWGHSDGAVIAALIGLHAPERVSGLILEAFHFYRMKPGSRGFFEGVMSDPNSLSARVRAVLVQEHGEEYWRRLLSLNGNAWLELARQVLDGGAPDLYERRLSELSVPAIFLHGSRDPRTEPDELDQVRQLLPKTPVHVIEGGGHSPHSENAVFAECNRIAEEFLNKLESSGEAR